MIRTAGNRIFAGLSRILDLPGSENLQSIDITAAQPTFDLNRITAAELGISAALIYQLDIPTGGADFDFPLNPYSSVTADADTRTFIVSGDRGRSPVTGGQSGILASDYDAYLQDFGFTFETATITSPRITLYSAVLPGAVAIGDVSAHISVHYQGTADIAFSPSGINVDGMIPLDNSRPVQRPIRMPNSQWADGTSEQMFVRYSQASSSAAVRGAAHARLLLVPKGTLEVFE